MFEECKTLPVVQIIGENTEIRCPEGRTKITRGYNLPAKCTLCSPPRIALTRVRCAAHGGAPR